MSIRDLVFWGGLLGYLALFSAGLTGLLRAKLNVHKALAIAAIVIITLHAAAIVYLKLVR